MAWLLDTNVLSELRRRDRTDVHVAAWADALRPTDLFLSVVTVMEIEIGAGLAARRDATQGALLRDWIETRVLPAFADRILPIDLATARSCARFHVAAPRAERDALIAATALTHGLTVATRNLKDFEPLGVPTFNPWAAP